MTEVQWGALQPILQDLADRVARIEQFLAASGLQATSQASDFSDGVPGSFDLPQGATLGQMAAAAHGVDAGGDLSQMSNQVPDYIVQLARSGKAIQAVKELRAATGMDLRQAKATIDQISRGY